MLLEKAKELLQIGKNKVSIWSFESFNSEP